MSPIRSRKHPQQDTALQDENKGVKRETRRVHGMNPLSTSGRDLRKIRGHQQFVGHRSPVKLLSDTEDELEVEMIVSSPVSAIEEEVAPTASPIQDPPPSSSPLLEVNMNSPVKGRLSQGSTGRYSPDFVSARDMLENGDEGVKN